MATNGSLDSLYSDDKSCWPMPNCLFGIEIVGSGTHEVVGYLHLHPDVQTMQVADNAIRLRGPGVKMMLSSKDGALKVEQGYYCPEFGKRLPRAVIVWRRSGALPIEFEVRIAEAA